MQLWRFHSHFTMMNMMCLSSVQVCFVPILMLEIVIFDGSAGMLPSDLVPSHNALAFLHCNSYCEGTVKKKIFPHYCENEPACVPCSCDDDCHTLGQCCPDHTGQIRTRRLDDHACIDVLANYSGLLLQRSFVMKTSCADGCNKTVKGGTCHILNEVAPVTSLVSNITYINAEIAECNEDTNHIPWGKSGISLDNNNAGCPAIFDINVNFPLRRCTKNYIQSCCATWVTDRKGMHVKDLCDNGPYYPVTYETMEFKNIFCYQCSGYSMPLFTCERALLRSNTNVLMPKQGINTIWCTSCAKPKKTCKQNQWIDPKTNVCRGINCRAGSVLKGKNCVVSEEKQHIFHLAVRVFTSNHTFLISRWPSLKREIVEEFQVQSVSVGLVHSVMQTFDGILSINSSKYIFGIIFMFTLNHTNNIDIDEEMSHIIGNILASKASRFTDIARHVLRKSKILHTDLYTKLTTTNKTMNVSHFPQTDTVVFLPRIFPSCPYITLNSNFNWLSNGWLKLNNLDFDIHPSKFTKINNTTVVFCLKDLREGYEPYIKAQDNLKNAENITSLVFCTLSLVCLAATLLTYCVFPSLLTLPTKNTMCLVTFLFLAQLTLQFGSLATEDELSCKIFGVLKHYLWLCVIFWMNVCSFHMFKVFVIDASKPVNIDNHNKKLVNYTLYANGISLAIPLLVIAINLVQTGGKDIGYGSERCYLTTPLLVGVAFLLPLGVVVFVNIILFIITIRTMIKIHASGSTANQDKGQMTVYIKLSSLTGMFWTFAILSDLLHQQVLVFIAIILNGSQGIFIFLSYIANKKILDIWKRKIFKARVSVEVSRRTESTHL